MRRTIHRDYPATIKQHILIARLVLEQMGEEWPATRGEASDLIGELQGDASYVATLAASEQRVRSHAAEQATDIVRELRSVAS